MVENFGFTEGDVRAYSRRLLSLGVREFCAEAEPREWIWR